jgi:hypothetical protein
MKYTVAKVVFAGAILQVVEAVLTSQDEQRKQDDELEAQRDDNCFDAEYSFAQV